MSRRQKDPLRPLTEGERSWLERVGRSESEAAGRVARARELLAVSKGHSFTEAAAMAGRRSGDTVGRLVARFNREGLAAIDNHRGGVRRVRYGQAEKARILAEFHRAPDREMDGTATWSVQTLRRALRKASDGLPEVSAETIWRTLRQAGLSWQRGRSWCETGRVVRKRKAGPVEVVDPDAEPKKS
ncbi:MAG: helix-turn-helix domain-containing protein [Bacteroidetes bacterium]|nr:helix-turn-helix domain-containing protein [Bacteroidota bacterium]